MTKVRLTHEEMRPIKKGAAYMRSLGKVYYGAWVSKELRGQVKAAAAKQGISAERYVTLAILSMLGLSAAFDDGAASSPVRPALFDLDDDQHDGDEVVKKMIDTHKSAKGKPAKGKPAKGKPAKRKAVK